MGSQPHQIRTADLDVLIIGSGFSGICSLYHIRKQFPSWNIRVVDAAPDVGGTWYWNCYPGCRFDSESVSYSYSFDKDFLQEWDWKETFSAQPDTHEYIRRLAAKHDLYKNIQFSTTIKSATWDDSVRKWAMEDVDGNKYVTRFFISCLGFLSAPILPDIPGIKDFKRQSFHTSRWPRSLDVKRDFSGKRIGIIGTGATGIQIITALSKESDVKNLVVFQRTANWSAPLRNATITREDMEHYKKNYDAIFQQCANTTSGFLHNADPRKSLDLTQEEREALWEKIYNEPGLGKWLGVFSDTYTNREANSLYSAWVADRIERE
jgi:cation diffusion facilitator CzcD-associated flavoprotein CzcO